jgi:hypothetical protein
MLFYHPISRPRFFAQEKSHQNEKLTAKKFKEEPTCKKARVQFLE